MERRRGGTGGCIDGDRAAATEGAAGAVPGGDALMSGSILMISVVPGWCQRP